MSKDYKSKTISPGIELYEDVVEDCQDFIDFCLGRDGWRDSTIFTNKNNQVVDKNIRETKILDLSYLDGLEGRWDLVADIFKYFAKDYCKKYNCSYGFMEAPQLLHYKKNNGYFNYHSDSGKSVAREFSSILYLNDVEVGGETHFENFNIKIAPKSGDLVMFPANFPYRHAALPPVSGDKFAIVTWFRN